MDDITILVGDAFARLHALSDGMCQTSITSPPYYHLRDYEVEGQIGQEETPNEYVAALVSVFREVKRVLCQTRTLWLNLGDCHDRKTRELQGLPWRVALALQEDGWRLISDIIWNKPDAMPERVTRRPSRSHEYLFLFAKDENYYYDADSIREPHTMRPQRRLTPRARHPKGDAGRQAHTQPDYPENLAHEAGFNGHPLGRNRRTVWEIPTAKYKGSHFAVFPEALVEPCVLATTRPGDCVIDPFFGVGTVGKVARAHGRRCLGIELSPVIAELARNELR